MNISVQFTDPAIAAFEAAVARRVEGARTPIETAMAGRFHDMVMANFGVAGVDRPTDWARLSPAYALKVKREIATLYVRGTLKGAVQHEGNRVFVRNADVPYATVHQYGGGNNIPARPYFPIDADGDCMPYTYSQVVQVAQEEARRMLS